MDPTPKWTRFSQIRGTLTINYVDSTHPLLRGLHMEQMGSPYGTSFSVRCFKGKASFLHFFSLKYLHPGVDVRVTTSREGPFRGS